MSRFVLRYFGHVRPWDAAWLFVVMWALLTLAELAWAFLTRSFSPVTFAVIPAFRTPGSPRS